MKTKNLLISVFVFCMFTFVNISSYSNNISVSNFSLTSQNVTGHYSMIKFDISWENSWRVASPLNNWDAAWVFVKYRIGSGEWQHTWLNNTGHINPSGSTITTGLLDPALPFNPTTNPGLGAFIYRDANGTGTFSKSGIQLRWNYGDNGVPDNAIIDIRVYAIEQVYVPQGPFDLGSGGTEDGAFYKYPTRANTYQITSEDAIIVGNAAGNLFYTGGSDIGDELGPIPSAFPKGYNAFYCMKYEISQQGYVDFLNSLTQSQANNRKYDALGNNRYAVTGTTAGNYTTTNPFVAMLNLSWADHAAYLDWSGLRPMTELEFEKSCRGTQTAVVNEYAWGTSEIANSPYTLSNMGENNENIATNYSTTAGNSAYSSTTFNVNINGPVRAGIFAGNGLNTGRVTSGATYYGIMEMTGNLWERPITAGNPTGRSFTGKNGNGLLDADGNADVLSWPPNASAVGIGFRGGNFGLTPPWGLQVSDRHHASRVINGNSRGSVYGGRGVRSVPLQ
ncbi:MAG: SUMF1/EgtB/PvdO family nonheme iron enzyme [Ignavibacteria bacterium]|nr:SUMF1/EgtB/PvdO family nonheme iron enzyme [Ignavibacteria bacterium]